MDVVAVMNFHASPNIFVATLKIHISFKETGKNIREDKHFLDYTSQMQIVSVDAKNAN